MPSKKYKRRRSVILQVCLFPHEYERLKRHARELGLPASTLMRETCFEELENDELAARSPG